MDTDKLITFKDLGCDSDFMKDSLICSAFIADNGLYMTFRKKPAFKPSNVHWRLVLNKIVDTLQRMYSCNCLDIDHVAFSSLLKETLFKEFNDNFDYLGIPVSQDLGINIHTQTLVDEFQDLTFRAGISMLINLGE